MAIVTGQVALYAGTEILLNVYDDNSFLLGVHLTNSSVQKLLSESDDCFDTVLKGSGFLKPYKHLMFRIRTHTYIHPFLVAIVVFAHKDMPKRSSSAYYSQLAK